MAEANAIVLHCSDVALYKIAIHLIESTRNEIDFRLNEPLPINLTLNDLYPEWIKVTPTGIEARIKSGIRVYQKILGREAVMRATIRIHIKNTLLKKEGNLLSRTKMIDFNWIEYPQLSMQDYFQTDLSQMSDLVVSKLSAKAFGLLDRKIEEEISSESINRSTGAYLVKTSFFKKWDFPKPTLSLFRLRYNPSWFQIGIHMQIGKSVRSAGEVKIPFHVSYSKLDAFLIHTLRDQIVLWPVCRISNLTTRLKGSVVETQVEFTRNILGVCHILWEFGSSAPGQQIKLGIRKVQFKKWIFPGFVKEWLFKRITVQAKKMFTQFIRQTKEELTTRFQESNLNIEVREIPLVIDVTPDVDGIVITVNEPIKIEIT